MVVRKIPLGAPPTKFISQQNTNAQKFPKAIQTQPLILPVLGTNPLPTKNIETDNPNRLVAFDVEGVLLPKRRYLLFEVARKLGLWGSIKIILIGFLYEIGFLSLESTLKKIFMLFRGLKVDDLFQLYEEVPLIPRAMEVFKTLNKTGCRTALISSGLPKIFIEDLAARLKANYAFGLELEITNDGHLTGEIEGDVIRPNGKALILRKILEREGLSKSDCVVIADDRNNLPMFPLCSLRIGYNPDFMVSTQSDFVIKGALSEILPLIAENLLTVPRPALSRNEIAREVIHVSGFLVPFMCMYLLSLQVVSLLILFLTLLYITSELARLRGTNLPPFTMITQRAAIEPEIHEFVTVPIFFALGIIFSLILFPVPENYGAIAILTLGDSSATLFGKKFGRKIFPLNKGKKVEGSVFGFLLAFIGALIFVNPGKALAGAFIGMLTEALPLPINDNLTVPIASGLAMTVIP